MSPASATAAAPVTAPGAISGTRLGVARSSPRPPNVIVVVLDCVRAKNISVSGGDRLAQTPNLERLAARGSAFSRAVAPANWTIPSHMSFFTGVYPNRHGVRTFRPGEAPQETIASWLARRGYDTGLFTEMVHLVGGYGLEDGFAHRASRRIGISDEERTLANGIAGHAGFLYSRTVRELIERLPPLIVPLNAFNHPQEVRFKREVCGGAAAEGFDAWVRGRARERPFFAFLNLVDGHEPYPAGDNGHHPGPLARWYARTPRYYLLSVRGLKERVPWDWLLDGYLKSIESADEKLGRLMAALEAVGELDRTMFVVMADHGQSFGEGGNVYHGCGATDSITRVPLVVAAPSGVSLPRRVDRWTSLCELPSWIRAAASGTSPYDDEAHAPFPHAALAPDDSTVFCEGAPASDPNRSLRGIGLDSLWNHRLLAAYQGDTKHVLDLGTGRIQRWVGASDPDRIPPELLEGEEARAVRERIFGEYEAVERSRQAADRTGVDEVAGEVSARLRSWGYG